MSVMLFGRGYFFTGPVCVRLFRCLAVQVEGDEGIEQVGYPDCDKRRYIAVDCKGRSNGLEQDVGETES